MPLPRRRSINKNESHSCTLRRCSSRSTCPSSSAASSRSCPRRGRGAHRHLDRPARPGLLRPRGRAPRPSPGSCSPTASASPPHARAPARPRLLVAVAVGWLARREGARERYDALTALVLVGALALGVILASDVFHSGGERRDAAVRQPAARRRRRHRLRRRSARAVVLAGGAPARASAGWRPASTRRAARGARRPLGAARRRLLALVALVAVAALSTLGALLATALLVVPAATTRLVCSRLRPWQLATVALVARRGRRRAVAVGRGQRAARRRRSPCSPAASSRSSRGRARAARAPAHAAARGSPRRPLALALAGAAAAPARRGAAPGQVAVVATTTQLGDFARAVGGDARPRSTQILQPNTDPHEYEPRPHDVRDTAGADVVVLKRRRARPLDGRRRRAGRRRPGGRRPRRAASRSRLPGRDAGRRRPRATTRTGGTTRATPRRPWRAIRDALTHGRPGRRAASTRATPPPTWRRLRALDARDPRAACAAVPAGAAQARHRPRRLRLLRPPLRRSRWSAP